MKNLLITIAAIVIFCISGNYLRTNTKAQISAAQPEAISYKQETFTKLINTARRTGTVRVIVAVQTNFVPEGNLSKPELSKQRRDILRSQNDFLDRFQRFRINDLKRFEYIPYLAFEADAATLEEMRNDALIYTIHEDEIAEPALAESAAIVGAPTAWDSGFSGSGQTVAVIDSGVDKNHPFLSGRVVAEGCYSSNVSSRSTSVCPDGATESIVPSSGLYCPNSVAGCAHGTNVAGIAAGRGSNFSGVAKDANVIAIQIYSSFGSATDCGTTPTPCGRYWTSDLLKGLERVRTLQTTINNIAAVNVSLQTGQEFASNCDVQHSRPKRRLIICAQSESPR